MIRVNDDYIIEVDYFNYTPKRDLHKTTTRTDKKTGEVITENSYATIGHYCNLTGAIKGIIGDMNRRELSEGVIELSEAVNLVIANNQKVASLLKSLEVDV